MYTVQMEILWLQSLIATTSRLGGEAIEGDCLLLWAHHLRETLYLFDTMWTCLGEPPSHRWSQIAKFLSYKWHQMHENKQKTGNWRACWLDCVILGNKDGCHLIVIDQRLEREKSEWRGEEKTEEDVQKVELGGELSFIQGHWRSDRFGLGV